MDIYIELEIKFISMYTIYKKIYLVSNTYCVRNELIH